MNIKKYFLISVQNYRLDFFYHRALKTLDPGDTLCHSDDCLVENGIQMSRFGSGREETHLTILGQPRRHEALTPRATTIKQRQLRFEN